MSRIAFATYAGLPELDRDDRFVLPHLKEMGIEVVPAVWNDSRVAWDDFDLIVLRSCWDYDDDPAGFERWLGERERGEAPVLNSPSVARWNLDKTHLRELADQGVPIIPTVWRRAEAATSLRAALDELGWEQAVVKPTISMSAHGTWRTSLETAGDDEERFREQLARGDQMIQRYLPEITRGGEWSLVFLEGEFSHACRKLPKSGDFRVQNDWGGTRALERADPGLIEAAQRVLSRCPGPQFYARVDGVLVDGAFLLMEVELIDPQLYLAESGPARARFAECLREALGARG